MSRMGQMFEQRHLHACSILSGDNGLTRDGQAEPKSSNAMVFEMQKGIPLPRLLGHYVTLNCA